MANKNDYHVTVTKADMTECKHNTRTALTDPHGDEEGRTPGTAAPRVGTVAPHPDQVGTVVADAHIDQLRRATYYPHGAHHDHTSTSTPTSTGGTSSGPVRPCPHDTHRADRGRKEQQQVFSCNFFRVPTAQSQSAHVPTY